MTSQDQLYEENKELFNELGAGFTETAKKKGVPPGVIKQAIAAGQDAALKRGEKFVETFIAHAHAYVSGTPGRTRGR